MVNRRFPRPAELRELLQPAPLSLDFLQARLDRAASIGDLRKLAMRRTPRAVFDYTDGAAGVGELALRRARETFARLEFHPTVLTDVSGVSAETMILGKPSAQPFALAPTGFTRMMHTEGERAVVAVAQAENIPYTLSTMGTSTIEEVAEAAPNARRWFQLYLWRDRGFAKDLVERAIAAGYDTIMLTLDTKVAGARLRDVRNGLSVPPQLTLRTFVDGAMHPRWWFDLLTTETLSFATLTSTGGSVAGVIDKVFDPAITMADLEWLREVWPHKLVAKGVQSVADAEQVVKAGVDGVLLSNHGGRQLDRAPVPLELVPAVREAVDGRAEVLVDTGITTGADVVAAVAMGANAALVGRAYLYGLMAGGQRGVARAVRILADEVARAMALLGVTKVTDLKPSHVTFRAS
ncbi:alpha-hydroxy acid oxidase [Pseudonocardia eucalypti]|uniref:Alpha-hydroxy acid oxidase n=1 Tax=Pseudonocardia eucalypti TaxID=648755 RepID=A0ABP9PT44_9PSEU|nr:L-lactate dehydrogenase (cytochrome) [Pseudonocardia eucalypti]